MTPVQGGTTFRFDNTCSAIHARVFEKMRNLKLHSINDTQDKYKKINHTSMCLGRICTNSLELCNTFLKKKCFLTKIFFVIRCCSLRFRHSKRQDRLPVRPLVERNLRCVLQPAVGLDRTPRDGTTRPPLRSQATQIATKWKRFFDNP